MRKFDWNKLFARYNFSFVVLLILITVNIIYWGNKKEGYHIDEIYSYGLANSYYNPFPFFDNEDYWMNWHDSQYLQDYITVSKDHTFAYDSVYYNQTKDVHPFLYYAVLHTVCSFFPGTFSKWYGLSVNIIFSILILIVLYALSRKFLSDRESLFVCAIYGLSAGAVSNAIYLRMYVMLTFFVVLYTYLHVQLFLNPQGKKKRNIAGIFMVTVLGGLTHYYFYVFACFVSIFYCLFLLLKKHIKSLISYCVIMMCALVSVLAIYPSTLDHVLHGYRGNEAVDNLVNENLLHQVSSFFVFVHLELFGGYLKEVLGVIFIIIVVYFWRKNIIISKEQEAVKLNVQIHSSFYCTNKSYAAFTIIVSVLMYFILIAQISTITANRYMFPVYPLTILLAFGGSHIIAKRLSFNNKIYILSMVVVWSGITVQEYRKGYVDYVYAGYDAIANELGAFKDKDTLYIADYEYPIYRDLIFLEEAKRFFPIKYTNFDRNLEKVLLDIKNSEDGIIVYVFKEHEPQTVFSKLEEMLDYKEMEFIAETYQSKIYYCH